MRLSWNEIRVRAKQFSRDWANARYERGETQSFYNEFFEVFGVKRRRIAVYERQVKKLNDRQGYIDLFWPGVLLVEQKSAGRDLSKARKQAEEYFLGLKATEHPRYMLLSDFQSFELYDLEEGTETEFTLNKLHENVEKLGFIIGLQKRTFKDQDPVNIEASELMGQVHDSLMGSGYVGHDLEQFLVRLLFCLFADDTGIFEPRGIFENLIKDRTSEDGTNLGQWLTNLFETINTPVGKRYTTIDEDLATFPFVNGELFADRLPIPSFDSEMRQALIDASEFSWDAISPAIFGALFQSVMDREERRKKGAHYTTEKNIMKVISSLFLDELRAEFDSLNARKTQRLKKLRDFHNKLSKLTFFDPACGCGNFLVIAYRELRQLELDLLVALRRNKQLTLDISTLSKVDVDQFYGLEISEFPVRIAEVAMWMMDHMMNNRLSLEFGQSYVRIPLLKSPNIRHGDALELDWTELISPKRCNYLFGNPPFVGAKYQDEKQRYQVRKIANLGGSGGTLDYVTAWFIKAGEFIKGRGSKIGFVATNSITQGEQVGQLWPLLFHKYGLEICFAHQTFAWGSDARGKANVFVVIIGLCHREHEPAEKKLFMYSDIKGEPEESRHKAITAYLCDAGTLSDRHILVSETTKPINGLSRLVIGSKPIDGGHYIFDEEGREAFLMMEPSAEKFLRPFVGAREFMDGGKRWILYLASASPAELKALPEVSKRISAVRDLRRRSRSKQTQKLAETPTRFHVAVIPEMPFLVIPEVSTFRREYLPIGWLNPPVIPSNLVKVMLDTDRSKFAILTSKMHMAWMRYIGGRLGNSYRYSIGMVYNTFPWPRINNVQAKRLEVLAQAIIDARASVSDSSLSDLYDPIYMPAALRKAHNTVDVAVDKLYRKAPFKSERERVEHLFFLYVKNQLRLKHQ